MPLRLTLAYGRMAASGLLGLDALYRAESGDEVGLAVLNLDKGGRCPPQRFRSYDDARAFFLALRGDAVRLQEPDRRRYYDQLCHSTLAFIQWRTEGLPFRSQLSDFLHVPAVPASEAELTGLREDLRDLLNAMGYNGDLRAQCAAWEDRNRVPGDEVEDTVAELMARAWELTEERVVEIPADPSDGMRITPVTDVAFNARCDYQNRTVELNVDPVLTLPGLRHLAVHEGCPGHYVQFKLREAWHEAGEAPADVLLSVVNTASSSPFEGIADTGLAMIGWDGGDDDRVQGLMNRYRAGIGTGAAWRLHALGRPAGEVTDWLREWSLAGGDAWVESRMRFISAPERAVLIWSYWWGEKVVAPTWREVPSGLRPGFVRYLYGRMHSIDTVGMFDGAPVLA